MGLGLVLSRMMELLLPSELSLQSVGWSRLLRLRALLWRTHRGSSPPLHLRWPHQSKCQKQIIASYKVSSASRPPKKRQILVFQSAHERLCMGKLVDQYVELFW